MTKLAKILATWFGVGLLPKAPGTWGSLAALPFAWVIASLGGEQALCAAIVIVILVGWWASACYVHETGRADPSEVVIDEVAGQWLTLLVVPPHIVYYTAGFLLFRLFDIRKPWLVGWADRKVEGGLGIMLDDIFAGIFAAIVLYAATWTWL